MAFSRETSFSFTFFFLKKNCDWIFGNWIIYGLLMVSLSRSFALFSCSSGFQCGTTRITYSFSSSSIPLPKYDLECFFIFLGDVRHNSGVCDYHGSVVYFAFHDFHKTISDVDRVSSFFLVLFFIATTYGNISKHAKIRFDGFSNLFLFRASSCNTSKDLGGNDNRNDSVFISQHRTFPTRSLGGVSF